MSASQIIRQPWVRWVIRFVGVVLILYLGLTVRHLHAQRQEARGQAASTLWFGMKFVSSDIDIARRELRDGHREAAVVSLKQGEARVRTTSMALAPYYALSPDGSAIIHDTVDDYSIEINRLWSVIDAAPTGAESALLPQITALQTDLERWQATFSVKLLASGSAGHLREAVGIYCQDLQVDPAPMFLATTCQGFQR